MYIKKLKRGKEFLHGFGIRRNTKLFEGDPSWQIWGFGFILYI